MTDKIDKKIMSDLKTEKIVEIAYEKIDQKTKGVDIDDCPAKMILFDLLMDIKSRNTAAITQHDEIFLSCDHGECAGCGVEE